MITEEYVSFETAKLLKGKGFSCQEIRYVYRYYEEDDDYCYEKLLDGLDGEKFDSKKMIAVPTQQMAMRWLREVHNLFIAFYNDDLNYCWCVLDLVDRDENLDPKQITSSYGGYLTYEQACEESIKYCLKNLI